MKSRVVWGSHGLIHLVYRAAGIEVPRFARDQYLCGEPVNGDQLQPGDLIFFASPKRSLPFDPHHAMMFMGNDMVLESTYQSSAPDYPTRLISGTKRFGKPIATIKNGDVFNKGRYAIYMCCVITSR